MHKTEHPVKEWNKKMYIPFISCHSFAYIALA